MVYNLDCYYIQLNAKNQVIHKPLQNCSPFRKLQTGHSLYPLIEMICRVKLFKILPDGVQLRLLLCTIKHKEQTQQKIPHFRRLYRYRKCQGNFLFEYLTHFLYLYISPFQVIPVLQEMPLSKMSRNILFIFLAHFLL